MHTPERLGSRLAPLSTFSLGARLRSFAYAARGLRSMLITEHNARIHAAATCAVVALGFVLGASRLEWAALTLAIVRGRRGCVDLRACATGAAVVGVIVFGPYVIAAFWAN
jgi:hypothetical protein